jgi:hypothetical protein
MTYLAMVLRHGSVGPQRKQAGGFEQVAAPQRSRERAGSNRAKATV